MPLHSTRHTPDLLEDVGLSNGCSFTEINTLIPEVFCNYKCEFSSHCYRAKGFKEGSFIFQKSPKDNNHCQYYWPYA